MELSHLAKPFHADEVEWRVQSSGMSGPKPWARVLCYVQARAVMDRLDEVCGPENWEVQYTHMEHGVMCYLKIRCEVCDGLTEWIQKSDGASETQVEAFKGGISSALKRAASVWGIGRYLYKLPSGFAVCSTNPKEFPNFAKHKDKAGKWLPDFSWKTPGLPSWALPAEDVKSPAEAPAGDSGGKSAAAQTWEVRGPDGVVTLKGKGKAKLPLPKRADVVLLTGAQLKKIHVLRREIGVSEEAYRSVLLGEYGQSSTNDLPKDAASHLIDRLEKRRKAKAEAEAKEAFGDSDESTRLAKLLGSARGFVTGIGNMKVSINQMEKALLEAGLPIKLREIERLIAVMTDEKELEQIVIKLEAVVAALAF